MTYYITSAALLSPQPTFEGQIPPTPNERVEMRLLCDEPDYKQLIPPTRLRRMSRILKMGLATAAQCINGSPIAPDSIIIGTGQGCTIDLEKFMHSYTDDEGGMLSPIPFINSGHNTLAGQIAMTHQIKGYNMTYLQENASLESSLTDAMMLLEEGKSQCVLVGATDEFSQLSFDAFKLMGKWREQAPRNIDLLKADAPGTIMGEGTGFFCISNQKPKDNAIELLVSESRPCLGKTDSCEWIASILATNRIDVKDIGTLIVGRNGDQRSDEANYRQVENMFPTATVAGYKHMTGEFSTANAFGLWLAYSLLKGQPLPAYLQLRAGKTQPGTIAIYNKWDRAAETLIVVKQA